MDTGKYKKAMRKKKYLDGNFVVYDKNLPEIGEVPKASATDVWNAIKQVSTGEDKKEVEASRDTMNEFANDTTLINDISKSIEGSESTDNSDNLKDLLDNFGCKTKGGE